MIYYDVQVHWVHFPKIIGNKFETHSQDPQQQTWPGL